MTTITLRPTLKASVFEDADLPPLDECIKRLESRMAFLLSMKLPKNVDFSEDKALYVQIGESNRLMKGFTKDWTRIVRS
jgi:hypothetical protein